MRLNVLGSSGAEFPGKKAPGFLVDDGLLLDAGTIGAVLNEDEQWAIKEIMLTHAHLDHILAAGEIHKAGRAGGTGATLSGDARWRYDQLLAWDATGADVPAHLDAPDLDHHIDTLFKEMQFVAVHLSSSTVAMRWALLAHSLILSSSPLTTS